jgi:hypothetical protein
MARRLIALVSMLLLSFNVQALDAQRFGGATQDIDASLSEQAQKQKRRDNLREATKLPMEDAPRSMRQLSPRERFELRQQLRQQRLELLK